MHKKLLGVLAIIMTLLIFPKITLAATQSPPVYLAAWVTSDNTVFLTWMGSASTNYYVVQRRLSGNTTTDWIMLAANIPPALNSTTRVNYTDSSNLSQGSIYDYQITACSTLNGCTPKTISITFSPDLTLIIPLAPSSLFKIGPTTESAIYLSWLDNSTNETGFTLQRRLTGGTWSYLTGVSANNSSIAYFTDSGLTPATSYEYQVQACNFTGCSAFTDSPAIWTQSSTVAVPPSTPYLASNTIPTTSNITITWTNTASSPVFFNISRIAGNGTWTFITSTALTTLQSLGYADLTVSPNTSYSYHVQACYSGGANCSAYSNTVTVSTPAATTATPLPTAPSSLFKIGPTSESAIDLSWLDNSTNETSFSLQRRLTGGTWSNPISVGANNSSIAYYTDSGLTPATSYEYQVQACNSTGCSTFATSPAILTQSSTATIVLPTAPSSLFKIGPTTKSSIYLSWLDNSTNETSFSLQRRLTDGTWSNPISVSANLTSIAYYTDIGLQPGTSYEYQVQACISTNCSAFTMSPAILTQSSVATTTTTTVYIAPTAPTTTSHGATVVTPPVSDQTPAIVTLPDQASEVAVRRQLMKPSVTNSAVSFSNLPKSMSVRPGNRLAFAYAYGNTTSRTQSVKLVRRLVNEEGKLIKQSTARYSVQKGKKIKINSNELISKTLPVGVYMMTVKVLDTKTSELLSENDFSFEVKK